jgi:hypothetical protein
LLGLSRTSLYELLDSGALRSVKVNASVTPVPWESHPA